ncbi:hypothetical protein BACCAP_00154 [Pseudoflavonifractor capillosus ATCC 29799]|uniref:Uncharacterized protein n=1 Tax=Pseudoflavonifractor capillosus ATCC 29799 TaxID=411467 RepID=A6NPN8_9FIRM|nr:hypothetical protein BACCAP_00154 [Pseudoflavonifractor capillosus ATCC 29799]
MAAAEEAQEENPLARRAVVTYNNALQQLLREMIT